MTCSWYSELELLTLYWKKLRLWGLWGLNDVFVCGKDNNLGDLGKMFLFECLCPSEIHIEAIHNAVVLRDGFLKRCIGHMDEALINEISVLVKRLDGVC
jgi:hypothetical protein